MITLINESSISNLLPSYFMHKYPDFASEQCDDGKCGLGLTLPIDVDLILRLGSAINAKTIFEFGTWCGRTTRILSRYFDHVYTLDCPKEYAIEHGLDNFGQLHEMLDKESIGFACRELDNVTQFYGDSADINTIREIRNSGHLPIDIAFIDGRHTYEYVICDTITALGLNTKMIIWHDVKEDDAIGVIPALNTMPFNVYRIQDSWVGFYVVGDI